MLTVIFFICFIGAIEPTGLTPGKGVIGFKLHALEESNLRVLLLISAIVVIIFVFKTIAAQISLEKICEEQGHDPETITESRCTDTYYGYEEYSKTVCKRCGEVIY